MKYTVEGLNQEKMIELDLDAIDSIILRWFIDFWPMMKKKMGPWGVEYGWVAYEHLIDDLPIIRITNIEVLGRRFNRYKAIKLMIGFRDFEDCSKTYFALNPDVWSTLTFSGVTCRPKRRQAADPNVAGLPTQKSDNPNTNDPSTNDPKKAEAVTSAPQRVVTDHYQALFLKAHGRKPVWSSRHFAGLSGKDGLLTKGQDADTICRCMDVYFGPTVLWFRKNGSHDFTQFLAHYNELLSQVPKDPDPAERSRIERMELAVGIKKAGG